MDLSNLLQPVVDSLLPLPVANKGGGGRHRTLVGAGDNAKPAVIAALVRDATTATLIVVPKSSRMQDLYEELGYWLGPDHARRIRLYPQRDILPYERAPDDPWDIRTRLETIHALHAAPESLLPLPVNGEGAGGRGSPPIVIASVEGIAQRTLSPDAVREAVSRISIQDRIEPEALLRRLQSTGYEIVSLVEAPGQAARRGGIVDVFPPQADSPARIEFFGPEVESIRSFDVETQRSKERIPVLDLGVASDYTPDRDLAADLLRTLDFEAVDEETERILVEELTALANGEALAGASFLPSLLSPHTLVDHLPPDATILLDDPNDLSRALDEYVAETATMRIEREARGLLPIGLPAAQANWNDLQPLFDQRSVIELSRFATEDGGAIRPLFSPAPGFGGRVRILARDLADMTKQGDSIIIVSQQAHRLETLLSDEGLPVRAVDDTPEGPTPGVIQLMRGSLPHGWLFKQGDGTASPPLSSQGEGVRG